jgi:hypothetical protein
MKKRGKVEIEKKIKTSGHRFRKEFNKTMNTAIVAAFSLIVALAWKDVITGYVDKIKSLTSINSAMISALFITFISVLGILIVSKIFSEDKK